MVTKVAGFSVADNEENVLTGATVALCLVLSSSTPTLMLRYFAQLKTARLVLWCYFLWYLHTLGHHFDPSPRLWMTSLGLSLIIGAALVLSTQHSSTGTLRLDRWQVFRLFLMPFCVSSFAALVKDKGFILVFPPTLKENLSAFSALAAFLVVQLVLRRTAKR